MRDSIKAKRFVFFNIQTKKKVVKKRYTQIALHIKAAIYIKCTIRWNEYI